MDFMDLIRIYQCLCDGTRLRIINLLMHGPLCVCHFQSLLNQHQVAISKHLAYLRGRGLVESRRCGQWMIYSLPKRPTKELHAHLQCLQDCVREHPVFRRDLVARRKVECEIRCITCGEESPSRPKVATKRKAPACCPAS